MLDHEKLDVRVRVAVRVRVLVAGSAAWNSLEFVDTRYAALTA